MSRASIHALHARSDILLSSGKGRGGAGDGAATEEELFAYCHENLARFKVPFAIRFRPRLPKTMIGKVLRMDLRGRAGDSP